jgi:predicted nucleic acid-binding protein
MVYVDTSVLVALHLHEPKSPLVARWYSGCKDELVSAVWCATEFASALSIKRRTGQIQESEGLAAWQRFERLCANDIQLLPIEPHAYHRASVLALEASSGLRAGDALHLAVALEVKAKGMATLDDILSSNARRMKLRLALQ